MGREGWNEDTSSWMELFLYVECEALFYTRLVGVEAQRMSWNRSDRNWWICAKLQASLEILGVNVHRPLQVTPENFGWSALSHGSPSVVTIRDSLPIFFSFKTSVQAKTLEEHLAIYWQVKSGSNTISVFYGKKLYSLYLMTSVI